MTEIRKIWSGALPALPQGELDRVSAAAGETLAQAAQCFWLFRRLHRAEGPAAVLAGDYCFGRFSHHLAALDSVPLTDAFAGFLRRDTLDEEGLEAYLAFLRQAARLC